MKITANEIKPGMIIEHKNDYWNVFNIIRSDESRYCR